MTLSLGYKITMFINNDMDANVCQKESCEEYTKRRFIEYFLNNKNGFDMLVERQFVAFYTDTINLPYV
jgi:hypothetical protein